MVDPLRELGEPAPVIVAQGIKCQLVCHAEARRSVGRPVPSQKPLRCSVAVESWRNAANPRAIKSLDVFPDGFYYSGPQIKECADAGIS